MSEPFHPYDQYSREQAQETNFEKLLENFEDADHYRDGENRVLILELLCSVSIARVRLLERKLTQADAELDRYGTQTTVEREQRAEQRMYGNVIPIRPKGAA